MFKFHKSVGFIVETIETRKILNERWKTEFNNVNRLKKEIANETLRLTRHRSLKSSNTVCLSSYIFSFYETSPITSLALVLSFSAFSGVLYTNILQSNIEIKRSTKMYLSYLLPVIFIYALLLYQTRKRTKSSTSSFPIFVT